MQSCLVGPLHLQAITEQKRSFTIHRGHAHTSTFAHTWNMGGVARGASAQQVPIHETNAVLKAWAYAPAANPGESGGRERRERENTH